MLIPGRLFQGTTIYHKCIMMGRVGPAVDTDMTFVLRAAVLLTLPRPLLRLHQRLLLLQSHSVDSLY